MRKNTHFLVVVLSIFITTLFSTFSWAECGGQTQCIGIGETSISALQAHHGGTNKTPSLTFGDLITGTTSAFQTVFVEAVSSGSGTVVLGALSITGADATQFSISGGTCSPSNGPVHGGANCTIELTFNPTTAGAKSAVLHVPLNPPCPGCITERTANLSGSGTQPAPVITSSLLASGFTGVAFNYQILASNNPSSFNATALPAGLSIDTVTGIISGVPTNSGSSNVSISATNTTGTDAQTLALTVTLSTPVITSSVTATGATGVAFGYTITATNSPTSYAATGLPPGISINTSTGVISGTPTTEGVYASTISAINASGTTNLALGITINLSLPNIDSSLTWNGATGVAFNYQITATNNPTNFNATGLPAGLSINAISGVISGTPTAAGVFNVAITASNATGNDTDTLVITITLSVPVINSAVTATGATGVLFSYTVTATNSPTSFTATGLPTGVSINTASGVISGIPTLSGVFSVVVTANNIWGATNQTVTTTISLSPPVINSSLVTSGTTGTAFNYQISADSSPTSFNAVGLPAGLSVNTSTGVISGTPTLNAITNISISATNASGSDTQTLVLTIALNVPVITSPLTASAVSSSAFNYLITATNVPTSFSATGLPTGLSVNTSSGVISGAVLIAGTYITTVSATNVMGTANQSLTITINPIAPIINSVLTSSGATGVIFSYQITANNNPTSFNATGLPAGLNVDTISGLISGTPTIGGTFNVSLSAANVTGSDAQVLVLSIVLSLPVINSAATATGDTDTAFNYSITATNAPTSFAATGLPTGLSINTTSGLVSGTPSDAGLFPVSVSATNVWGTANFTVTLTVGLSVPTINSALTSNSSAGTAFSYLITASSSPTSFNAVGLPSGLILNASTGQISGVPAGDGVSNVSISATNATGTDTKTLVLTIAIIAPTINSPATVSGTTGIAFNYQVTATSAPTSYGAVGLPLGISIDVVSGVISGIPTLGGVYLVSVTATNASGTANQTLTIDISVVLPTIQNTTFNVPLNSTTNLDLSPFISGPGIIGINITTAPIHGSATNVSTMVSYTPVVNYFGTDSFSYVALNADGISAVTAVVTINVVGTRPDPTNNLDVRGLIESQRDIAQRFSRAQIMNIQRRTELLHLKNSNRYSAKSNNHFNQKKFITAKPLLFASGVATLNDDFDKPGDKDQSLRRVANALVNLANNQTLHLSLNNNSNTAVTDNENDVGFWIEGNLNIGSSNNTIFNSEGISLGADSQVNKQLALGVGIGLASDTTKIGDKGSKSNAVASLLFAYSSYQISEKLFADAVIGIGVLDLDSLRYEAALDEFAIARRSGSQMFGSLSASYEYRDDALLISPYGRFDFYTNVLDAYSETNAGQHALSYSKQTLKSNQLSMGIRVESSHAVDFGWVLPHFRFELNHELEKNSVANIRYADQAAGPIYTLSASPNFQNTWLIEVGSDFIVNSDLKMGVDYKLFDTNGNKQDQVIAFWLSKNIDGKSFSSPLVSSKTSDSPIQVETGFIITNNLSKDFVGEDLISEQIYDFKFSSRRVFPLTRNTRVVTKGFLSGDRHREYTGLNRLSAGAKVDYQYRTSSAFDAVTFGLFGRVSIDNYNSVLRSGASVTTGLSVSELITDKIGVFAALQNMNRSGEHNVFDLQENSIRVVMDYSLGRYGAIYVSMQARDGDTVTSNRTFSAYADVSINDDVYNASNNLIANRIKAKTTITSLGYNLPFGVRDAFDFVFMSIESTPKGSGGTQQYKTNQFSATYIMRF